MASVDKKTRQQLVDIAHKLRVHSINMTTASNSGHPTSCASMAEIMSVLFFHTMRYKISEPRSPHSDRFILSKGHAAPILYAAWSEAGLIPAEELLKLRKIDNDLEGHPTPKLSFVDVATGSLGQGLGVACGMAYVGKHFDKSSYRTYCLIGDGESAEGSIWEAMNFAGHYKLDNLVAIFDVNRLGQSDPAPLEHDMETYRKRCISFGFNAIVVDGHDVDELCKAFHEASITKDKPTAVICKTFKGMHFVDEVVDKLNWHGKPLGAVAEKTLAHLKSLIQNDGKTMLAPQKPLKEDAPDVDIKNVKLQEPPAYNIGDKVATRVAYGTALMKLCQNNKRVIGLDGDTKNSTYSEKIKKAREENYIECYIAEQNLVSVAIGAGCRNRTIAFVSTFAAFFSRAFDQLRMGAISQTNINCVGSHCGVSIGEDGPSQMALEDLAMFRAIPNSTVFYPSDAVSCERACELAATRPGICFIRTSRPATAVLYDNAQSFQIGRAHVVRQSDNDSVLVIGAGITLHNALKAADQLAGMGVHVRVLDPFTIKPLDVEAVKQNAKQCGGRVLTVEDHYPAGGIGEAVSSALSMERDILVKKLAVNDVPRSGPSEALMDMFGIGASNIVKAVQDLAKL